MSYITNELIAYRGSLYRMYAWDNHAVWSQWAASQGLYKTYFKDGITAEAYLRYLRNRTAQRMPDVALYSLDGERGPDAPIEELSVVSMNSGVWKVTYR